jgi:5-oxoprolinase (ATP-hydrolysing)
VVIAPLKLLSSQGDAWDRLEAILRESPWPSRDVRGNLSDIRAAVMAVKRGVSEIEQLVDLYGPVEIEAQMQAILFHARARLRTLLVSQEAKEWVAQETMDDGSLLNVRLQVKKGKLHVDFSGSSPLHPGNLNAPKAVVISAIVYVLRLWVGEEMPLNEGLLEDVVLTLPEGMLNPPFSEDPEKCPALVGGNVETSQVLVDTLLKALGLVAGSQGTMNNLIFGNEMFSYYETLAGGAGATAFTSGASAVHVHMTNSRITDAELLELRYPVRVESFSKRSGSAGVGLKKGGEGLIRHITFQEAVTCSLLAERRRVAPYGLKGGSSGICGEDFVVRSDGKKEDFPVSGSLELKAGEGVCVMTPGGGAWGESRKTS